MLLSMLLFLFMYVIVVNVNVVYVVVMLLFSVVAVYRALKVTEQFKWLWLILTSMS